MGMWPQERKSRRESIGRKGLEDHEPKRLLRARGIKPVLQFHTPAVVLLGGAPELPDTQPGRHWEPPELHPSSDALDLPRECFLTVPTEAQDLRQTVLPVPHLR